MTKNLGRNKEIRSLYFTPATRKAGKTTPEKHFPKPTFAIHMLTVYFGIYSKYTNKTLIFNFFERKNILNHL